jgi:hypothetical protein
VIGPLDGLFPVQLPFLVVQSNPDVILDGIHGFIGAGGRDRGKKQQRKQESKQKYGSCYFSHMILL